MANSASTASGSVDGAEARLLAEQLRGEPHRLAVADDKVHELARLATKSLYDQGAWWRCFVAC